MLVLVEGPLKVTWERSAWFEGGLTLQQVIGLIRASLSE